MMSVEKYLQTSFELDAEFIDGEVRERTGAEEPHSAWHVAVMCFFAERAKSWGIRIRPSLRIKVRETCYLVPDVALLDATLPEERYPTHPPVAVFEILSPEDRFSHAMRRFREFERMGVAGIYFVDPGNGRFMRYREGSLTYTADVEIADQRIPTQEIADQVH